MSSEAVKKRGRPKKVAEVVMVVNAEPSVESATGKKTKARKVIVKAGEEGTLAKTVTKVIGKKVKEEEVAASKKIAASKRPSAKKPEMGLEALTSPVESLQRQSVILEQAQAFSKPSKAVLDDVPQIAESRINQEAKINVEGPLNERPEGSIGASIPEPIFAASLPSNQTPPPTSPQNNAPITPPMPQSSFLNSFLNDPEPAPPPPPDSGRRLDDYSIDEPTEPQANADMISTPASQQPKQVPKQPSSPALPPGYTITESLPQLRAYTTTSFKALKANSPPSRPMFAATSFAAMKGGDVKSASTSTKSSPKPSEASTSPGSKPTTKTSPSTTITRPNPHSRPPTRTSRAPFPPTQPPPQPQPKVPPRPLRPTEMPMEELLKNPEFRSKRRQWVSFIVSAPIAIGMSYELYRRYKIESANRVEMGRRMTDGPAMETTMTTVTGVAGVGGLEGTGGESS